ncbi:MAG TPA: DUF3048 domain-containing protein [Symbiobacteriaceae bacterium]|nr:DUF3048 domain-containing protein [Symbiobacteriaceae bacterium]
MKRTVGVLLIALILAASGCSKAKPTNSPPPAPEPQSQAQPQPEPPKADPPKPVEPVSGPIYLLEQPAKPLWAGPASVVIENSPQAHPQAGYLEADLVVEGLAESEVTRTLAFYWSRPAAQIGPVRSARTWLVALADAYHSPFAHSGGNMDALAELRNNWGASNLDEIYTAGGYFYRSNDREPPHNLYIATDLLGRAVSERGINMKPVPTTPRAPAGSPAPSGGRVTRVDVAWHPLHTVTWQLDGGQYKRSEHYKATVSETPAAEPHMAESGEVVASPNLVMLEVQGENNGWELGWTLFYAQGGKATVISAGTAWEGTWKLGDGGFALTPADGAKVPPLAAGPVWVQLISPESAFSLTRTDG